MAKEYSLLIYNLFIATPRAKEARSAFLEYIVEFVLFNSEVSLTSDEIIKNVNNFFPNPVSSELISKTIKSVAVYGKESVEEKKYSLNKERRDTFSQAINKFNKNKDAFYNKLINKVEENISEKLSAIEKKQLCEVTEGVITTIFSDKYKIIEQFFRQNESFDISKFEEKEYDNILKNEIKKVFKVKNKIEDIEYGIIKALKQLDDNGMKYVTSIFHKIFAYFYLNQEPNELKKEILLLKQRRLYLDANVVLGLIFPSQGKQNEICSLINKCKELKIRLFITPNTLKEIEKQFRFAEKIFRRSNGLNQVIRARYLNRTRNKMVIVDDYLNERIENRSLDWDIYIKSFKPISYYLNKRFSMQLDENNWTKLMTEDDQKIDSIRNAIKNMKENHKKNIRDTKMMSSDSLICDSENIYFIHQLRNNFQADDMGIRVWHLTYDMPLVRSERLVRHEFEIPACMTVSKLADFLIPFSMTIMEEVSHNKFIASLLAADFGAIVEDENYVDIDFYANLSNSGLPLENIINITDDRFTRKMLIIYQKNRLVKELADEAGRTEEVKRRPLIEALNKELIISSAEAKLKEKIDNLNAKVNKLELKITSSKMKKEGTLFGDLWKMLKDKIRLYFRVTLDLFSLSLFNYLIIWVYSNLDIENKLMWTVKFISHAVIILFFGFDAIKELKKAWKETKEF